MMGNLVQERCAMYGGSAAEIVYALEVADKVRSRGL